MHVPVNGVNICVLHVFDHHTDNARIVQEIVGVKNPNHISRCHCDAFVHRIIKPLVGFRNVFQTPTELRFVALNNIKSCIRRCAVHKDVFNIIVVLVEYALYCIFKSLTTIVCGCDNTYLHVVVIVCQNLY